MFIKDMENITLPRNLRSLKLIRMPQLTDSDTAFLKNLTSLSKITFIGCNSLKGDFFRHVSPSLTSVKLWFNREIEYIGWIYRLRHLKKLDISGSKVRDNSFQYLPPSVGKLSLSELKFLSDESLKSLPNQLDTLELDGKFTLYALGAFAPNVTRLTLSNCTISYDEISFPKNLTTLTLVNAFCNSARMNLPESFQQLHYSNKHYSTPNFLRSLPKRPMCIDLAYTKESTVPVKELDELFSNMKKEGWKLKVKLLQPEKRFWD